VGGLAHGGWLCPGGGAPVVAVGVSPGVVELGDLNLTALGEERAGQLGLEVERFKRLMLATGALLAGAAVSVSGVIGFVGLMTPHILRTVIGPDHRRLIPASVLGGAASLVLADLAARTALSPQEIPVGAVTAILGGP